LEGDRIVDDGSGRLVVLDYGLEDRNNCWEVVAYYWMMDSWSGVREAWWSEGSKSSATSDAYYLGDKFLSRRHVFFTADGALDYFNTRLWVYTDTSVAEVLCLHYHWAVTTDFVPALQSILCFHRTQAD
jgi:hypothetical protein